MTFIIYPLWPLAINHFLKVITKTPSLLFLTCPEEIKDIIMHMTTKLSAGFDNVSIEIIKLSIKYIVEPLSHLVNNSLTNGQVPDSWKIATVCPIFKSGNNADITNYRPISVLLSFSKILEKLVYSRLLNYLSLHSILSDNQYGFWDNHNTSMAVLEWQIK